MKSITLEMNVEYYDNLQWIIYDSEWGIFAITQSSSIPFM